MDAHAAHLIVDTIAAVGLLVWLVSLRFLLLTARKPHVDEQFNSEPTESSLIHGMAEVDGEPEDLSLRAASILAKGSVSQLGPVRIISRADDAVVFEGDKDSMGLARYLKHGAIHFAHASHGKTRIEFALDVPQGNALLWGGAIFQALGLVALGVGYWSLNTYVAECRTILPFVRSRSR